MGITIKMKNVQNVLKTLMYILSNVTMLVDKDLFVMNKNVNLFVKIKCRFFLIINVFVSMECKELTDNAIIVK